MGVSGNAGVAELIANNTGYIGYVEAANAISVLKSGLVGYATVNGKDPVKDLPQTAAALVYNTATTAPLSPGPKLSGCVQLVKPSAYANITKGYPIVAVTNFLFSSNGNGSTNAGHLRTLVSEVNTPSLFGVNILTVNKPTTTSGTGTTGFAALGSTFNTPLKNVATRCIGT